MGTGRHYAVSLRVTAFGSDLKGIHYAMEFLTSNIRAMAKHQCAGRSWAVSARVDRARGARGPLALRRG